MCPVAASVHVHGYVHLSAVSTHAETGSSVPNVLFSWQLNHSVLQSFICSVGWRTGRCTHPRKKGWTRAELRVWTHRQKHFKLLLTRHKAGNCDSGSTFLSGTVFLNCLNIHSAFLNPEEICNDEMPTFFKRAWTINKFKQNSSKSARSSDRQL